MTGDVARHGPLEPTCASMAAETATGATRNVFPTQGDTSRRRNADHGLDNLTRQPYQSD